MMDKKNDPLRSGGADRRRTRAPGARSLAKLGTVVLMTASVIGTAIGSAASAAPASRLASEPTINLVLSGASSGRSVFYVAYYAGLFKKYHINVNIENTSTGTEAAELLAGGKAQFMLGQLGTALGISASGVSLTTVAEIMDKYQNSLIIGEKYKGSIKTFGDLANKPIGISGVGSGTWQLAEFLAHQGKLTSSQTDLVSIGGPAIQSGADLVSGGVAAQVAGDPADLKLVDAHQAAFLADADAPTTTAAGKASSGWMKLATEPYAYNVIFASKSFVAQNPAATQAFVDGLQAGIKYMSTHKSMQTARLLMNIATWKPFGISIVNQMVRRFLYASKAIPSTLSLTHQAFDNTRSLAAQLTSKDGKISYSALVNNKYAVAAAKLVGTGGK